MSKLIRMDFYRMIRAKMLWVCIGIMSLLHIFFIVAGPYILEWAARFSGEKVSSEKTNMYFASQLQEPFQEMMILFMLLSVVSFMYADMANGYIKNIAGQVPKRGYTAVSKFIVAGFHNFIFMLFGVISGVIGGIISPKINFIFDIDKVPEAILIFFVKLLLGLAITSLLLFITTGLRSKTFAVVMAVLFGVSALTLIYTLINNLLGNIIKDVDITKYLPDVLIGSVVPDTAFRAIVVAVVYSAIFLVLTVKVFNSRDVK